MSAGKPVLYAVHPETNSVDLFCCCFQGCIVRVSEQQLTRGNEAHAKDYGHTHKPNVSDHAHACV